MNDELSPETRALLARGRDGAAPTGPRRSALRRQILAKAAAGAIVTTSATAAAGWTTAMKVGVASVAVFVATGAGVVATKVAREEAPPPAPAAIAAPAKVAVATKRAAPIAPTPPPNVEEAPAAPEAPVVAEPVKTAAPRPRPLPIAMAPKAVEAQAVEPAPAPKVEPAPVPTPAAAAKRTTLAEEAALLREAHLALGRGDGVTALRLLDEHAARFPTSVLEPERGAERIFALCAAGDVSRARLATRRYLEAHPAAPLSSRVSRACGGDSR